MDTGNLFRLKIENGPSQDVLFDSCKYAGSENVAIRVEFLVTFEHKFYKHGYIEDVMIRSIRRVDWSGDELILHGYCRLSVGSKHRGHANEFAHPFRFEACYRSKHHKGEIVLFDYNSQDEL